MILIIYSQILHRDGERKDELLIKMSKLLMECRDDNTSSEWIMYFLGKVQSNLHQDLKENIHQRLFSLNLYMFCIVVVSGCAVFVNNELSMSNRLQWLNKFPEALWLLRKRSSWTSHMPRVI